MLQRTVNVHRANRVQSISIDGHAMPWSFFVSRRAPTRFLAACAINPANIPLVNRYGCPQQRYAGQASPQSISCSISQPSPFGPSKGNHMVTKETVVPVRLGIFFRPLGIRVVRNIFQITEIYPVGN
jgi:hypothetical protein